MTVQLPTEDWLAVDERNRERAIDPQASFIIEAPAGAGKTELLTQRFLALLARVNDPEEIVALTFTHKAAAEMRHRILGSLQTAALGVPPEEAHKRITYQLGRAALERDRQRGWGLLGNAARLQVTTLDALCGRLARQMPLLSRLGSQPAVATDAEPHYADAVRATLQALEDDDDPIADRLHRVLDLFDNDTARVSRLLQSMLAARDQWLRHGAVQDDMAQAQQALRDLVEDALRDVLAVLPPGLQRALCPAARYAASQVLLADPAAPCPDDLLPIAALEGWTEPLAPSADELPRWRALAALLLTKTGTVRSRLPSELRFNVPEGQAQAQALKQVLAQLKAAGADGALAQLRLLPDPVYTEAERQVLQDLTAVLQRAHAELWLVFQAAGEVDFTQVAQNALQALGTGEAPTELQLRLDYRIAHLLVDEFQDTSPTQVELLRRLTAGWQAGDGRTLFLVGDPMQSIYKFRKADVGLFLKVRDAGLGAVRLHPLKLFRNNRSHTAVVDWVNRTFPGIFAAEDQFHRGAVRFAPAQATRGDHPLAQVVFHPTIDTGAADAEADEATQDPAQQREAEAVVALIRQAQAQDPDARIAVLVRARTHLAAVVAQLRLQGLPFQAVEIEPLGQRQAIQDLLSLTRALCHLGDRTAWLAVLRAPWCGLTLADLHALAADDHASAVWTLMQAPARTARLSTDGQARLEHVRGVLAEAFEHQGRQRPRRWVEGVWQCLGGPWCLQDASEWQDAQAFCDLLDAVDDHGSLDLDRLYREVAKLYAAADPNATAQVQVMTIHKSKGLEFDTVILPGLHRKSAGADRPLLLWDEVVGPDGQERLVVAPLPSLSAAQSPGEATGPNKFAFLARFEAERQLNESQRLLYVAVTRARRQLHLLGTAQPAAGATGLRAPAPDSLLRWLWPVAAASFDAAWAKQALPRATEPGENAQPGNPPASSLATPPAPSAAIDPAQFNHRLRRLARPAVPTPMQPVAETPARPLPDPVTEPLAESLSELMPDRADPWADAAPGSHPEAPASPDAAPAGPLARHIGTLVHRYLEWMARDGLAQWPLSRLQTLEAAMTRWFAAQGHTVDEANDGARQTLLHLHQTLASEDGRWVLAPHEQAACEVPLTALRDGQVSAHVVDRTFVVNGVRWIVDYKTAVGAGPGGALSEMQQASYRAQLERYRQLYPGQAVQVAVFLTDSGRLVSL